MIVGSEKFLTAVAHLLCIVVVLPHSTATIAMEQEAAESAEPDTDNPRDDLTPRGNRIRVHRADVPTEGLHGHGGSDHTVRIGHPMPPKKRSSAPSADVPTEVLHTYGGSSDHTIRISHSATPRDKGGAGTLPYAGCAPAFIDQKISGQETHDSVSTGRPRRFSFSVSQVDRPTPTIEVATDSPTPPRKSSHYRLSIPESILSVEPGARAASSSSAQPSYDRKVDSHVARPIGKEHHDQEEAAAAAAQPASPSSSPLSSPPAKDEVVIDIQLDNVTKIDEATVNALVDDIIRSTGTAVFGVHSEDAFYVNLLRKSLKKQVRQELEASIQERRPDAPVGHAIRHAAEAASSSSAHAQSSSHVQKKTDSGGRPMAIADIVRSRYSSQRSLQPKDSHDSDSRSEEDMKAEAETLKSWMMHELEQHDTQMQKDLSSERNKKTMAFITAVASAIGTVVIPVLTHYFDSHGGNASC